MEAREHSNSAAKAGSSESGSFSAAAPAITLPKGGGAIRGMGEKFAANPVTGTGSMSVPIATSPGRSGFGPQLALSYDSGADNGPFGFGWNLSLPAVTRKTDKGLPQYRDTEESDIFILSGAEDLVPVLVENGGKWVRETPALRKVGADDYLVYRYRPRTEGLFARIERWTSKESDDTFWRSISRDNITTYYGKTSESRIADPADPAIIFSWLMCESYDDKGNTIVYTYAEENSDGVDPSHANEQNRTQATRKSNRYLKRVKYGNKTSRLIEPDLTNLDWHFQVVFDYGEGHYKNLPDSGDGHDHVEASEAAGATWPVRMDPISSYRSGFEVRTYRLCRRVLMFHSFPSLGTTPCLVRSTNFTYEEGTVAAFITAATHAGYVRQRDANGQVTDEYLKQQLPPLEFTYSKVPTPQQLALQPVEEIDPASLENLPAGLDGARYQWVDLDGEGISGVLAEQLGAWYYKENLGDGHFGPVRRVAEIPSLAAGGGNHQLLDLAGDGQLDVVLYDSPTPGFYERTFDSSWEPFRTFVSTPNVAWRDPNVRFVDLTGDGHADLIISEDDAFVWHRSLAEDGFAPAQRVAKALDEEKGPHVVFADGTETIFLSDMSGDGLTDLVRIRNGEVCYWPNLGYGRFGAKVTMDNAPWFDAPDLFDPQRIRLADTDGSGVTDILYLKHDGVHLYFNQSGNGWSMAVTLPQFPRVDDITSIQVFDLLGIGTACLVWSSPLPGDARRQMRYVDLMGGIKPHLLIRSINNLGAETLVQYASSIKFYLEDKRDGKPWITKLPFPVHVVERVETYDRISRNRFVTRHAYHHGYFDGVEREFRGFGMVEQWDTEEFAALSVSDDFPAGDNIDAASHVPPVHTKTWFHTGVFFDRKRISNFFSGLLNATDPGEYYREPGLDDAQAKALLLDDTVLPGGLSAEEEREACRALKGAMLRQEVYALDGTDKAQHPYTVTEQNFTIRFLQPQGQNPHAVFFSHPREVISYHYERNPADPRIGHALTPEVDDFGNVLKSLAIGYGRRQPDPALPSQADRDKQTAILITYTENNVTNAIDDSITDPDNYRTPLPSETRTVELTGFKPAEDAKRFSFDEWVENDFALLKQAVEINYEETADLSQKQKRLIEHVRTRYRKNDLTDLLPPGTVESLAIPGESYKLAFTPGLARRIYVDSGKLTAIELDDVLISEGRYVHSEGDANWWIPSGRIFFSPGSTDTPPQELAHAHQHFFLPCRYRDPFHTNAVSTESFVSYDAHDLLMVETRDALGNVVTVATADDAGSTAIRIDYRVLQPYWMTDPNGNRAAIAFDALGMVVGTAVMGKPLPAPVEGDSLDGFEADLTAAAILDHLADPLADPQAILRRATTRLVYDMFAYQRTKNQPDPQPAAVYTLARETHDSDPVPAGGLKIQHSFSYSDGFGREIQKKIRAEPGPVPKRDADGKIIVGADGQPEMTPNDVSPRWVGSGWTVFNNKGKPVRQFEPFFTDTHRFESDVRIGVSPVLFYDPVGRAVATLHPNHTWEKVVFDPWRQEAWDVGDTVLVADPKTDPDVGDFFRRLPDADYLPTWHTRRQGGALGPQEQAAAGKAAIHAQTPSVAHADSLGRSFLTVAHNKFKFSDTPPADPPTEEFHRTRVIFDIEGNQREVIDAKDRIVMRYDYDMLGTGIHQTSMEAGERWMLNDLAGQPTRAWDSRAHAFRTEYDPLRRPLRSFVAGADSANPNEELLTARLVYGEQHPEDELRNLRGKLYLHLDQAGVVTNEEHDFKGNPLRASRRLAREYKEEINWSAVNAVLPVNATAKLDPIALEAALAPLLEAGTFTSRTSYDALNRPVSATAPDNSVYRPTFNEANLLEKVDVNLRGAQTATSFVTDIDYDAKGQRTLIDYGNGVRTTYTYDPLTFRLTHLLTRRDAVAFPDDCPQPPPAGWPGCQVQSLHYTYDPVGNITHIRDDAQQTLYFRNQRVEPSSEYTYDAIYRLIDATGREHLGQVGGPPIPHSYNDTPRVGIDWSANDGNVMGTYIEQYLYDAVGNFLSMQHRGSDPVNPGWSRSYAYNEPSLIEPAKQSNRLSRTTVGGANPLNEPYAHDAHGNMTSMPHLTLMQWDFKDQLSAISRQVVNDGTAETTYYVYDAAGQRVRKVTERQNGTRKNERTYLGGFEVFREYDGGGNSVSLERESLHVMDDQQRIALVETRTDTPVPEQLIRYQFGNHLGSASLELDDQGQIISYEEYYPYGSTSYQAGRSAAEVSLKRYRYTGMERDEETGLSYHEARYYAPWLGRWASCDPIGVKDGVDLYVYAGSNPTGFIDPTGTDDIPSWYRETTRETKDDAEIQRRLQNLDARDAELRKLVALSEPKITPSPTGRPEDAYIVEGIRLDPELVRQISREQSLIAHAGGTLISMLKLNQRRREIDPVREQAEQITGERWEDLSDSARRYWRMKLGHPEWQVRPNIVLDMTGSIVEESQSTDVQIFQGSMMAGIIGSAMTPKPGGLPATEGSVPISPDFKAPRGTASNPIPVWELVRFPTPNNSRYIPTLVRNAINRLMNSPLVKRELVKWGKDASGIAPGTGPGSYQIGHDPARPFAVTPKGTPTKVFGQLWESNNSGAADAKATKAAWEKLGLPVRK
jgi:RHS repeat-associated protein